MLKRLLRPVVLFAMFSSGLGLLAVSPQAARADSSGTIYNSIPKPLPGNLPSVGAEAYAFNEFGNQVGFAGTARKLKQAVLTLSSWGCQSGHWYSGDCATTPGAKFPLAITFNIYTVGANNVLGSLIATRTQTFLVPYRPSVDSTHCTGGRWFQTSSHTCFNGLAANVTFDFTPHNLTLPNKVIFGVAYNTSHYGYHPVGESAVCFTSSGGCPYDSLNIALSQDPTDLSAGSDPVFGKLYQNSPLGGEYCDGGLAGTNTFRLDSPNVPPCWGVTVPTDPPYYIPSVKFVAKKNGDNGGNDHDDDNDDNDGNDGNGGHHDNDDGDHHHHGGGNH